MSSERSPAQAILEVMSDIDAEGLYPSKRRTQQRFGRHVGYDVVDLHLDPVDDPRHTRPRCGPIEPGPIETLAVINR
jgi:hypothetical protein